MILYLIFEKDDARANILSFSELRMVMIRNCVSPVLHNC